MKFLTALLLFFILNAPCLWADEKFDYHGYNLILISLGNVGTRHMSLYGYGRKTTPFLDEWSKGAIVFNDLYSPASWTLPTGTSLFTSLQPYSHKVFHRRHNNILDPRIPTLAEVLKSAGYSAEEATGGLDYNPSFGHMRGFSGPSNKVFTSFTVTLGQSEEWLQQNHNKKFFLFIHGYDAHCPFTPPEGFRGVFSSTKGKKINVDITKCYRGWGEGDQDNGKYVAFFKDKFWDDGSIVLNQDDIDYLRDLYDEEVLYEDFLVGKFLKSLDPALLAKTVIIVMGDHGELFAKHGRFGRAGTIRGTLYESVVHVPLIMKLPGKQPKRIDGFVQLIDLMPTILKMLGLPVPSTAQGRDLAPLMSEGKQINYYVYGGTRYWPTRNYPYVSECGYIRSKEWKLIHESRKKLTMNFDWMDDLEDVGRVKLAKTYRSYIDRAEMNPSNTLLEPEDNYELYNENDDPDEQTNLYSSRPEVAEKLKQELEEWKKKTSAYEPHNSSKKVFSKKNLKLIREGGYW